MSTSGREAIWQQGCRGESLTGRDRDAFTGMAHARFHAFEMSASHAEANRAPAEAADWIAMLIAGLVRELAANPGLEREWHDSEYALGYHGRRVSARLAEP